MDEEYYIDEAEYDEAFPEDFHIQECDKYDIYDLYEEYLLEQRKNRVEFRDY